MTLLDDMLALLPDNTSGNIGADDIRSIVTTLYNEIIIKQPLDSDLTTISGLTATTDNVMQAKGSVWASRTIAQLLVDLAAVGTTFQPLDSDLTAIAALTPANDDVVQRKAGAWSNRTLAQFMVDLAALGTTFQPLDSDLTTIAGLTATTDNFMVASASAWASRTPAQAKTALAIAEADVANLVSDLSGKQPLDADLTTIAALTATTDNVIQSVAGVWASRTPAQLKAAIAIAQADVSGLTLALAGLQPLDSDLTVIAAIAPANDDIIQRKAGAWTNRTMAQLKSDLAVSDPKAARFGLKLLTIDTSDATGEFSLSAGTAAFVLAYCPISMQVTTLGTWINTGGITSTGANTMAIYDAAGNQLGITADMSAALTGTGYVEGTLTGAVNLTQGIYYLHLLTHFTTAPKVVAAGATAFNHKPINGNYPTVFLTTQTTSPATFTPSTATQNTAEYFFGAR